MHRTRTSARPWGAPGARRPRARVVTLGLGLVAVLAASTTITASPSGAAPAPAPGEVTPAPAGTPAASIAAIMGSGYVESEWFVSGTASTYRPAGTWGSDGRWAKVVDQADQPFTTRFVVDRPADPARFNGTVWVEWLNVTAGADAAASVVQARDHIVAIGAPGSACPLRPPASTP